MAFARCKDAVDEHLLEDIPVSRNKVIVHHFESRGECALGSGILNRLVQETNAAFQEHRSPSVFAMAMDLGQKFERVRLKFVRVSFTMLRLANARTGVVQRVFRTPVFNPRRL